MNINLNYFKGINYVLHHNRIPICQTLEIHNDSEKIFEDVKLICEGEFFIKYESLVIAQVRPNQTVRIQSFNITPDSSRLAMITERIATTFSISIFVQGGFVDKFTYDVELMPYDHWLGSSILPQTIASFITPNHPSITQLIVQSANIMKSLSGSSSLCAYQRKDTNHVRKQVAAVFATLHQQGIIYRSIPASFEELGQRITMPDQVIASKTGNCIELTLLMAAILEAIGINSIVILQKSHAYLGVWLVDDCYSCSVCENDAAFIEKKISQGIDEMLVIECTAITNEETSFESAVSSAIQNLADHSDFEMFIDVKRCRLEKIYPLPSRIQVGGNGNLEPTGVEHDSFVMNVKEHARYDLSKMAEQNKELTKFDIWERKLLDFSLRNSLLNLYIRKKAIQFISFDIDKIEDHLQDGEEYCITPKPNMEFSYDTSERLLRSKRNENLRDLIREDIERYRLHTYQTESETKDILKNIYRAARIAIEETGANSLYLTIGVLRWFESVESEKPRYAPLLLLPVEIVYKKGNYYIRTRDEEITLNITLVEFLRQNFGIRIGGLDPLPKDASGVNVSLIFAIIRDALKDQKNWDVEEECVLGTFSFSKFLMWNDIHNNRELLKKNRIINSLVENRLTWVPTPIATNLKEIDKQMSPVETALPVHVDSSQMAAIIESNRGNSFILYGPPGTGKSQTITNLIANALYQGKRVLFVAEKMAALSVVQSRLEKIGLGPFCLELHSNKSTKSHVLQQLEKALKVIHIMAPEDFENKAEKIFEKRKTLIAYMEALHNVDNSDGMSLYDCILRYESIDAQPLESFKYDSMLNDMFLKEGINGIEDLLGSQFEMVLKLIGQPSKHPLNGLRVDRSMIKDIDGVEIAMNKSIAIINDCIQKYNELQDLKSLREKILRDNAESLFEEDADTLYNKWREARSKWFIPRFFAKKSFINYLKKFNTLIVEKDVDGLIDSLSLYQKNHRKIGLLNEILKQYFNIETNDYEISQIDTLEECITKLHQWLKNTPKMRDWLHWSEYCDKLSLSGMKCVVDAMQLDVYEASSMRKTYLKALFKYKAEEKIRQSEMLITFEGMLFDEVVSAYKRMTEEFQLLTQKELYARLASRIPQISDNINSSSEIGRLNRCISNKGRGISLRELFDQLPTLLPRLCPCMLMSPMSVAQYIDFNQEKFDLVIFDEASQMPTSEAVGAIARGKSLIVVGDPKQMPPTSFFSSTNVDVEEVCIDDLESILEDCRSLEIPSLQLSWHYRSQHESLIAFSNNEYYDGSLITFPSVDDQETKVYHKPIDGFYDKGGKRHNVTEAEAIVSEIKRRLEDEQLRKKSIGVIAFSVAQQCLIEDLLQTLLDNNKDLQELANQMYEPIFVKNLENVQGDERDIILFSIGYGPNKEGKVSMNFGPLNNSGGERRLNVAVSRARQEMYVFSTLKSSDIDLRRSNAIGVRGLKHFLEYAETQSLSVSPALNDNRKDSIIAEQIALELKNQGYVVTTNVGRSRFKVDIAIADKSQPNMYRLGILLDGDGYRNTNTTRDRDIVQPSVLSALNWKVMRVWSVDWFNNKERILNRIEEQLSEKKEDQENTPQIFNLLEETKVDSSLSFAQGYNSYAISFEEAQSMSDKELMYNIISAEQPIMFMYLCRRICALRNLGRVTPTIQRIFNNYTHLFYQDCYKTLWITEDYNNGYSHYRPNSNRDISEIPIVELFNAIKEVLIEQVAINQDDLSLLAAKKMGFARRGANVEVALKTALEEMSANGIIEKVGNNIRLK